MADIAISVKNLQKSFGKLEVLKDVSFEVKKGSIVAMLGPNGAGKTTTVRILSTLLKADDGHVLVNGHDVKADPDGVRKVIGLTGQAASIDELLTGRENLIMMGRLYRLTADSARARAEELLKDFDLVEAADRPAKTYSGGMRRRLDLAVSLIATPPIIFLDEPTTGLDPRSRLAMWDIIEGLVDGGTTILLTTQYLEEADQLADNIIVIDDGVVIAEGTASELKRKIGEDRLVLSFNNKTDYQKACQVLAKTLAEGDERDLTVGVLIKDTNVDIRRTLDVLHTNKLQVKAVEIHKPTLDDVFLAVTGKQKETQEAVNGK